MEKVLILTPDSISVKEVENFDLDFMQNCVGGYIERILIASLEEKHIDVYCNEEGKFNNLPATLYLLADEKIYDVVVGDVLFCKFDDEGNSLGLDEEDIVYLKDLLGRHKIFAKYGILPYLSQEGE